LIKVNFLLVLFSGKSRVASWTAITSGLSTRTSNKYTRDCFASIQNSKSWVVPSMSYTIAENDRPTVEAVACSGLDNRELSEVMRAVQQACQGSTIVCGTDNLISMESRCSPPSVSGALGRVLLMHSNMDEESIEMLQFAIAEQMDELLYSEAPSLDQPVFITIRNDVPESIKEDDMEWLNSVVEQEVEQYGMTTPLAKCKEAKGVASFVPTLHLEIDGAQTVDPLRSTTFWDTSTVLVFDGLVSEHLRKRLLDVALGRKESNQDDWDDVVEGPNPNRWVRGGLSDIPNEDKTEEDEADEGPCWGLTEDAVGDICFHHHDAIEEFETILSDLFPRFTVTRLPEAVFGTTVSPLTANAPTHGDTFNYHIDGDPSLTPPSPWTDVYGRYPNRARGKPRFVSCLVYLNEEWNGEKWGAPTRFLDPPTEEAYEILPCPGRVVIMDQDVGHTVVSPTAAAGKRPRYSLVWKLILHPKESDQDMFLAGERISDWPEPVLFGSAQQIA